MQRNSEIRIDKVWELRFVRNSSFHQDLNELSKDGALSFFYAFDYYDKIICKPADNNIGESLGLYGKLKEAEASSPITSNYMTLVSLKGDEGETVNPFSNSKEMADAYPYLSLVMISILSDAEQSTEIDATEKNVYLFLNNCVTMIREKVRVACEGFYRKRYNGKNKQVQYDIFHSLNSGAFCVALRSNDIDLGYHIAMCLKAFAIEETATFPRLQLNTFTITGIAQNIDNEVAVSPKYNPESEIKSDIALRLAIHQKHIKDIASIKNAVCNERGLYGRYDITITLSMSQFLQVYPWIYAHKFGTKQPSLDRIEEISDDIVKKLVEIFMSDSAVQCINERVLVNTDVVREIDLKTFSPNQTLSRNDRIHKEKEIIEEKIRNLRLVGYRLPYHHADFVQLLGMVTDVWRNFENLRNQADSFVNGNMFFAQIWFLLDVIETYIKSIDEKSQLKVNYDTLVVQFRKAVNCISRFHKMMQSVNQQSMQAPNYEIQIHCDLEKFIVSYTEFARRFLTGHIYPYADDEVKSLHQYVLPICTVDSNIDSIEADPLFLLPYITASSQKICQTNSERERLLLSINMPNIEIMGRLYHTLPMICHEVAHNFRVVSRKTRNDALCRYMISKLSVYVVRQWFGRTSKNNIYVEFGVIEEKVQSLLAEELFQRYLEYVSGDDTGTKIHDSSNIGVLLSNLLLFLDKEVFVGQDSFIESTPIVSREMLADVIKKLATYYQQYGNIAEAAWYPEYQPCLDMLSSKKEPRTEEYSSEDRKRVSELTKNMYSDIVGKLLLWINEEMLDYLTFIDKYFDINTELEEDYLESLKKGLREVARELLKVEDTLSPLETDRLIIKIEYIACNGGFIDKHSFYMPKADYMNRRLGDILGARKEQLKQSFRELGRILKNTSLLWRQSLTEIRVQDKKESLYEALRYKLGNWIKSMEAKGDGTGVIFGSEEVQNYLLPLGIDQDKGELFKESLDSILNSVPMRSLNTIVNNSAQLYREIFADLGMCVSLGLDVFGYLMVFGTNTALRNNGKYEIDPFGTERILTVCRTLSNEKPDDFDERCERFFDLMTKEIESCLTYEGLCSVEYNGFKGQVKKNISEEQKANLRKPLAEFDITKIIENYTRTSSGKTNDYERICGLFESLWYTSLYIYSYKQYPAETANTELIRHFRDIYTNILAKDTFETAYDSHVLKKVGRVYNEGIVELNVSEEEEFKDTLSFVLFHYYQNWGVYSKGCSNPEGIEGWINRMIGRNM